MSYAQVRPTAYPDHAAARSALEHTRCPLAVRSFRRLAALFTGGLLLQALLAGVGIFYDPHRLAWHRSLGHALEGLAVVLAAIAIIGRLPVAARRRSIGLVLLLIVQGATAGIGGLVGALHPANALLVFWATLGLARSSQS